MTETPSSPTQNKIPLSKNPILWSAGFCILLAAAVVISLRPKEAALPPVLGSLPAFDLKDQDGKTISLNDFKKSVSLVNFIFTTCPDVCPLLTAQMAKIQARAKELEIPVKLASISVDPENDTPDVLKVYAAKYHADLSNWSFLTGPLADIEKVVLQGFRVGLDRSATDIFDITHTEHFIILDEQARIRAYRRAPNNVEIDKILNEVRTLVRHPSVP